MGWREGGTTCIVTTLVPYWLLSKHRWLPFCRSRAEDLAIHSQLPGRDAPEHYRDLLILMRHNRDNGYCHCAGRDSHPSCFGLQEKRLAAKMGTRIIYFSCNQLECEILAYTFGSVLQT